MKIKHLDRQNHVLACLTICAVVSGCAAPSGEISGDRGAEKRSKVDYAGTTANRTATVEIYGSLKSHKSIFGEIHDKFEARFSSGCINESDRNTSYDGTLYFSTRKEIGLSKSVLVEADRPLVVRVGLQGLMSSCYRDTGFIPAAGETYVFTYGTELAFEGIVCEIGFRQKITDEKGDVRLTDKVKHFGQGKAGRLANIAGGQCARFKKLLD